MAIRLSKAFGSTAKAWIDMQTAYDLARGGFTFLRLVVLRAILYPLHVQKREHIHRI